MASRALASQASASTQKAPSLKPLQSGSMDYSPLGRRIPGPIRISKSIPARYIDSYRDLLVIAAILVFIPWAIRLYNDIGDANNFSEGSLSSLQTSNSISMFQICTQLSESVPNIDCAAILSNLKLPEPLSSALAQDESQSSTTTIASSTLPISSSLSTSSFSSCGCSPTPTALTSAISGAPTTATTFSTAFSTTLSLNQSSTLSTITASITSIFARQLPASTGPQQSPTSTSETSSAATTQSSTSPSPPLTLEQEIGVIIASILGSLSIAITLNLLWSHNSITQNVEESSWTDHLKDKINTILFGERRALQTAAHTGNVGTLLHLLDKKVGFDRDAVADALEAAAYGGNEVVLRVILERKGWILEQKESEIQINNNKSFMRTVLEEKGWLRGRKVNATQNNTEKPFIRALCAASFSGDPDRAPYLILKTPFVRALCAASFSGNPALIPHLILKTPWSNDYARRKAVYREIIRTTLEGGNMYYVHQLIEALVRIEIDHVTQPKLSERKSELQNRRQQLEDRRQDLNTESQESGLTPIQRKTELKDHVKELDVYLTKNLQKRIDDLELRIAGEQQDKKDIEDLEKQMRDLRDERGQKLDEKAVRELQGERVDWFYKMLHEEVEEPMRDMKERVKLIREARLREYEEGVREELEDEVRLALLDMSE